jgi:AAA+ ATPase superfamily predicted ATPase
MANKFVERPFDDFRTAITDPPYFFGRKELLQSMWQSPFRVRILLGGRRLGKTSALRAIEWGLLGAYSPKDRRPFPVFVGLEVAQPESLDNLRYLLISHLRDAITHWGRKPGGKWRQAYRGFLSQFKEGKINTGFMEFSVENPDYVRRLGNEDFRQALLKSIEELRKWEFEGICFLLDEAEFIVRKDWANNAWSYFRGLKDNDTALKPFLGFLLAGYRDVKEYEQRVGSPLLGIAEVVWLSQLSDAETLELIAHRLKTEKMVLDEIEIASLMEWVGGHPFLTQQMLNLFFNARAAGGNIAIETVVKKTLRHHDHDFTGWWNIDGKSDGFGEDERVVYKALLKQKEGTPESLEDSTRLSQNRIANALDVLAGTGVIVKLADERYGMSLGLFKEWVIQQ